MAQDTVPQGSSRASRRAVVGGFVGLGVGVPLVAACGSGDSGGSSGSGGDASGGGTTSTGSIAKTTDIPVGEGKIFPGDKVLVSQPTEGEFKAFSTICTHQSCAITELLSGGKEIECTCHHSKFSVTDGSNTQGPNNDPAGSVQPLHELKVSVSGQEISVS